MISRGFRLSGNLSGHGLNAYLYTLLLKQRNDDVVQSVVRKGKISEFMTRPVFQEKSVSAERGRKKEVPPE